MKFIIELTFVLILLASIWTGYKKGLIPGIATLLSIIISMYVGSLFSETFSPELEKAIHPFVRGYMEGSNSVLGETLDEILVDGQDLSVDDAVKRNPEIAYELSEKSFYNLGLYPRPAKNLAKTVIREYDEGETGLSSAIVSVVSDATAFFIAFIIFFALSLIILTVILNLMNLNLDLPKLNRINSAGGIASGALIGVFFCFLSAWILKFADLLVTTEKIRALLIGNLFMKADILNLFLPY